MFRHIGMIVVAVVVVVVLLVSTVAYTVPSTHMVLVKTFGRIVAVRDGSDSSQAGLHFKLPYPIQRVHSYDARTFVLEDALVQVNTRDKQAMLADVYCAWRVKDPVVLNQKGFDMIEAAETKLRDLLRDAQGDVFAQHDMSEFINTDEKQMRLADIAKEVQAKLSESAQREYGVEVVQVGVKSLGLPENVTKEVIKAMQAERQREATDLRTQGEAEAMAIRTQAEAARTKILDFADTLAERVRAEGDAAAAQFYDLYSKDEELSIFLRELESMKEALGKNTVIVLDPQSMRMLEWLSGGYNFKGGDQGKDSKPAGPADQPSAPSVPGATVVRPPAQVTE